MFESVGRSFCFGSPCQHLSLVVVGVVIVVVVVVLCCVLFVCFFTRRLRFFECKGGWKVEVI